MSGQGSKERPQRRVLMLEDNDTTMRSTADYLAWKLGCRIDLRADAALLEDLKTTRYDLILLDFMIHTEKPGEDGETANMRFDGVPWDGTGLEFLRRLRRGEFSAPDGGPEGTPATVPVIILSAKLRSAVERDLKDELALSGWFGKPCDFDQLTRAMATAWGDV